ncbi:MAG: MATE family efflux transporter [Xanthomonadales bacterium]|nr:MATE family efflux transporter [Xanthomonadales bacterium]
MPRMTGPVQPVASRGWILRAALPIMAANIATPLVGIVDVALIGRSGSTADIAAVALAALVFNILFWSFGFLRMGATALTAQADGAGDEFQVRAQLIRGALLGLLIGTVFVIAQWPIRELSFALFSTSAELEAAGKAYFDTRIWGSPAALAGFAIYGWLIGLGRTGAALMLQVVLNVANIVLSIWFVYGLDTGVAGLGAASALALWLHLAAAAVIIVPLLRRRGPLAIALRTRWRLLLERRALQRLLAVNRDIFLRTLALLAGFAWFNEASLREGAAVLAGNAILLQFIAVSAYFLDAFAHVTETVTGRAAGRGHWPSLRLAFIRASELAVVFALLLTLLLWLAGPLLITAMTTDATARAMALQFLPWCALVPLAGVAAYQLDGLMIGATRGALMRNAMLAALAFYLALDALLRPMLGGHGLWLAFLGYYLARAGTLALGWPGLRRDLARNNAEAGAGA